MKLISLLFIITATIGMSAPRVFAQEGIINKVIYGDDNRRSLSELDAERDAKLIEFSGSVLAQIPNWRINQSNRNLIEVKTKDLSTGINFCTEEKYAQLPSVSSCSAFLVGPDLILTAGHCVKDKYDCKKQTWVLDFNSAPDFISPQGSVFFNRDQSYQCAELVSWSNNGKLDYSLVRLDRIVASRKPLAIRRSGKVDMMENLAVIGHPLGLPKVFADNIWVRTNDLTYTFKTNADTFSGNSGSPVIGLDSGLVEGMIVRGEDDFELNLDSLCQLSKKCSDKECRGETVLRSSVLPLKLIPKI